MIENEKSTPIVYYMKIDENLQHASFIISITVNNMSNLPTTRQFKKLSDVCIIERG